MEVRRGRVEDCQRVMEIVRECVGEMRAAGIDQWDDVYPNQEVVRQDAEAGALYLLIDRDQAIGAISLNEVQAPEYADLPWRYSGRVLALHRLCVLPSRQNQGGARKLMDFAEAFASSHAYDAIRLDTYTGNPRALAMYERRGYEKAGQVSFPRRKLRFDCLERTVLPKQLVQHNAAGAGDIQ